MAAAAETTARNIVFVHPDLGIGGAERLVIDAAVGLQNIGHKITILTSYRDTNHCFEEARDGTFVCTLDGGPASGQLSILFSIVRQLSLVLSTTVLTNELRTLAPDVIVVDQLSACIPFFRLLYPQAKILFYGHFPDRLLAKEGQGAMKRVKQLYRIPFDIFEEWSTSCSDSIVVNSKFTRSVFRATFKSMRSRDLKVIYPCVDTKDASQTTDKSRLWSGKKILLSINRFEGKKNLELAIRAYANLSVRERSEAVLIVAGGFDPRAPDNAATYQHLQNLCELLKVTHATYRSNDTLATDLTSEDVEILFLLSIPHELKVQLLNAASLLVYTPKDEHFGIVPLEAMLAGVPVLATNSGGPLETIYDGRTGWLRSPEKIEQWTEVMRKPMISSSIATLQKMGDEGRKRVLAEFTQIKMTETFDEELQRLCQSTLARPPIMVGWALAVFLILILAAIGSILALRKNFSPSHHNTRQFRRPVASQ
nr:alpha-1,3/1,6-mannosyltransferase alg-2 [Quercus suber]